MEAGGGQGGVREEGEGGHMKNVAGRIWPAGLVFDSCAVDAAPGLPVVLKGTSTRAGIEPPTPRLEDAPADL
ncbi:hypothetical protein EYF80_053061 [Liparis tanakae]|uniref:Uncharacterized protein n=1 Tax=Liparis tanakae TaxID=230148 RepID=A0A4Z2F7J3_9TELE|nr:hypothetical protein EYF80_053061 [Liparis tanakae]